MSEMSEAEKNATLRSLLRHTWGPFFSRHSRLTLIQQQTIMPILEGKHVVIVSPTASGKTEAVVAPTAERFIRERWDGLAVLYIAPTRALVNDTLERIHEPLRALRMRVDLKHGDHAQLSTTLPHWLITTPESLDSLLCRRPEILTTLRTVILDEIHLLDHTYRGDQLRLLLWRLRQLVPQDALTTHLMSATLAAPDGLAARYTSSAEIVVVPGQRDLHVHYVQSDEEIKALMRQNKWFKALYFCNRREDVETRAQSLEQLWTSHGYQVVAHHGSLSKAQREWAEQMLKQSRTAIGVATSTLEIGIDIGNIDLVVLADPPWSIASLFQRVGRGNRRSGRSEVAILTRSEEERLIMSAMVAAACAGKLEAEPYSPELSVAAQQALSLAYQHHDGTPDEVMIGLLSSLCKESQARRILTSLEKHQLLVFRQRRWFRLRKLADMGERGLIHSNIPDSGTYQVLDVTTGREVGSIAGLYDRVFLLARRAWEVVGVRRGVIHVRPYHGIADSAIFRRQHHAGAFAYLLPPNLE